MKIKEKSEASLSVASLADPTTRNRIRKHLYDINDVITEEDIRNVKVLGTEDVTDTNSNSYAKKAETAEPEEVLASWNVLS